MLRQVVERGGLAKPGKKPKKEPFSLSYEARRGFEFSSAPISVSELAKRINDLIDTERMSRLRVRCITDWLLELGFLYSDVDAQGRKFRRPTAKGAELGLSTVRRSGERGDFIQTLYDSRAQQFILDNLDAALEFFGRSRG